MNLDDAVLISKMMRKEYKEDIFFQNKKKAEYNVHKTYPTLNHSNLARIPLCIFSI